MQDLKAGTKIRVTTQDSDASVATRIEAIEKNELFANTHDAKFVSITGNKLVMTGIRGKGEKTCTLTADAEVTCDGTVCKSTDLKPGMRIRVTSESDDPDTAIRVEARIKTWNSRVCKIAGRQVSFL